MAKKQIRFSLFSVATVILLGVLAIAVVNTAMWENNSNSITIVKGDSAYFDVSVNSFDPGASYSIDLYDDQGVLVNNLRTGVTDASGFYTERVNVTPTDYNSLGGLFYVIVNSNEGSGLTYSVDTDTLILNINTINLLKRD